MIVSIVWKVGMFADHEHFLYFHETTLSGTPDHPQMH